jgi:hypothetical protein
VIVLRFPPDPLLPLIPSDAKGTRSWPVHEHGRKVTYHRLSWLLTHRFPHEAFVSAYSVPEVERRLSSGAVEQLPTGVPLVVYLFDYDCAAAHLATGGSADVKADNVWWALAQQRVAPLFRAHPGGFLYRTPGGARIVYQRPAPLVLREPGDELVWRRDYCERLTYFARRFGIVCDPTTYDWPRLMRLPRATRNGVPLDLEMVGNPRAIGALVYDTAEADRDANLDTVRAMAEHDARWTRVAKVIAGNVVARPRSARSVPASVDPSSVDAGVLAQLAQDLGTAMRGMVGNHAAHLALAGACYDRGVPLAAGPELGRAISAAKGGQDRSQVWATTAARVAAGEAVTGWGALQAGYPHLAAIIDAALPSGGGAKALRDELDARGTFEALAPADVEGRLFGAIDRRDAGPSLVRVTEGAGKTRVALRVLQDRARAVGSEVKAIASRMKALYVAPTHAVAQDVASGLEGLRAEYWRSPLAVVDEDGRHLCTQHARVSALAAAGHSVTAWCESPCPDLEGCPARAEAVVKLGTDPDASPAVVVTVHALLQQGMDWAGDGALVLVDEDPEAITAVEITRGDLDAAAAAGQAGELFIKGEDFRAPVLQALGAGLERGELIQGDAFLEILARGCAALADDTAWVAAALDCYGTTDPATLLRVYGVHAGWRQRTLDNGTKAWTKRAAWAPWPSKEHRSRVFQGRPDPRLVAASKVHALVGRLACGIVREAPEEGMVCAERGVARVEVSHLDASRRVLRGVMASPAVGHALRRYGPTVLLDATADPTVLNALAGAEVPTVTIRVADGAPVTREVLYWSAATRRSVFAGSAIRWDAGLARYLAEALQRAVAFRPGGKVAVFGWMALVDVLRRGEDATAQQLAAIVTGQGGTIVWGHYGAARGRNDWMHCDALVSVGDPHQNLGASRAIAAVLGLSDDHQRVYRHMTAAELSQVSGRLRAPWRTIPGLHLHVGTVAPLAWDASASVLELPKGPADVLDASAAAHAVHVYGSQRLAAASLGVHHETVRAALGRATKNSVTVTESPCLSTSHRMPHVTPSEILDGILTASSDTAELHAFSSEHAETPGIRRVSVETLPVFDDSAQFDLIARCGGPKAVAHLAGVGRATAYSWATARNTRRMPDDVRERLEAILMATQSVDEMNGGAE